MFSDAPHETAAVLVTGIGILTPLADSLEGVASAWRAGCTGVVKPSDAGPPASRLGAIDVFRYANVRGMRAYARSTQLQICAARRALDDAGLELASLAPTRFGLVSASTVGHLESLLEYDGSLVMAGVKGTNPALMPLALHSAPGALTALSFGAKAFSITLSDGGASGLAAIGLGAQLLREQRADVCLVTGAFTECADLSLSALRAELLTAGGFRVFDARSAGTAWGELAVALVLETANSARARGTHGLALVGEQVSTFSATPEGCHSALQRAAEGVLRQARLEPTSISLLSAGANGIPPLDRAEARALLALLGEHAERPALTAIKASLGESLDASGLVQAALTIHALRSGVAGPIVGLEQPATPGLRYLTRSEHIEAGTALVTSISLAGACSALTLSLPS